MAHGKSSKAAQPSAAKSSSTAARATAPWQIPVLDSAGFVLELAEGLPVRTALPNPVTLQRCWVSAPGRCARLSHPVYICCMTFLNPLLLIGLAAAAIPLIIHLFNFRRPRRVEFSSLAFLHELKKSTMQRVRVKQWLLLALRTLAIASLVIAFARPTMTGPLAGTLGGGGRTTMALVVDRSPSMTLRDGGGAYLDQLQTLVDALLEDMESGDEILLVPVPADGQTAAFHQNAASAAAALADLQTGSGSETLTGAVRRAGERLADRPTVNRDVFVLSDFQNSTVSDTADVDLPDGTRVLLMPVGTDGRGNVAVSEVRVLSQIVSDGQPVRFEAVVTNHGSEDIRGLVVSLTLEGQRIAQATVDVAADSRTTALLTAAPRGTGWLTGSVELEDNQYLFDNRREFALHVPEERTILLVEGAGTDTRYLRLALSSELAEGTGRFATDRIAETALASTTLGAYDAVVLAGVQTLSSGERAAIGQYLEGGGGLLLFAGDDIVWDDYNALMRDLGAGRVEGVIEAASEPAQTDVFSVGVFDRVDTDHPLFEGMFEPSPGGESPTLEQPVIFRSVAYEPGGGNEQTIIGLSGGRPFLQEIRSGQGSILFYATEAGASWSDFPVRGLFLPMLYRSLVYLSAGGSVTGDDMEAGSSIQLLLQGVDTGVEIQVRNSDGESFIPEQREVFGGHVITLSGSFFLPGSYDVLAGEEVLRRVVVHPPGAESDLALADPVSVAQHFSELTGTEVGVMEVGLTSGAPLQEQLSAARTGVELWNVFLGLALIFLLAEMVVAKQFRPEAAA